MEEFLTVFNEARNNKEAFYTASQRLTDFSKTIRSKQLPCIGKLSNEDVTPSLRRIEKAHNLEFAEMPPRTWFFEGETFISPEFKQQGKRYQINKDIKALFMANLKPQAETKKRNSIKDFIDGLLGIRKISKEVILGNLGKSLATEQDSDSFFEELEENDKEQEESDLAEIEEEMI